MHVVCLCGGATKQWFTLKNKNTIAAGIIFSTFLLCFHISKMQPDVGCVRHEVGPDLTPTGMLEGSAQFSREKKGGEAALVSGQRSFIAVNYLLTRKSQSAGPTAGLL